MSKGIARWKVQRREEWRNILDDGHAVFALRMYELLNVNMNAARLGVSYLSPFLPFSQICFSIQIHSLSSNDNVQYRLIVDLIKNSILNYFYNSGK